MNKRPYASGQDQTSRQDEVSQFLQDVTARKQESRPARPETIRRNSIVIGALIGLVYGVISESINSWVSPGIPFYHGPLGASGNILVTILAGTLIGLACGRPKGALNGALAGCVLLMVFIQFRAWVLEGTGLDGLVRSTTVIIKIAAAALVILLSIPYMMVVRWSIDTQNETHPGSLFSWQRLKVPLLVLVLSAGAAYLSLASSSVRTAMVRMNDLIREGLQASSMDALPAALSNDEHVMDFLVYANSKYALEESFNLNVGSSSESSTAVISNEIILVARFEGGYTVTCNYHPAGGTPRCRSSLPTP